VEGAGPRVFHAFSSPRVGQARCSRPKARRCGGCRPISGRQRQALGAPHRLAVGGIVLPGTLGWVSRSGRSRNRAWGPRRHTARGSTARRRRRVAHGRGPAPGCRSRGRGGAGGGQQPKDHLLELPGTGEAGGRGEMVRHRTGNPGQRHPGADGRGGSLTRDG